MTDQHELTLKIRASNASDTIDPARWAQIADMPLPKGRLS